MKRFLLPFMALLIFITGCKFYQTRVMEYKLTQFIQEKEKVLIPLTIESNKLWYASAISGKEEDYKKSADLSVQLTNLFTSKEEFEKIKAFKASKDINDPILLRELELLYLSYLGNQADPIKLEESIRMQSVIENKFSAFRAMVSGDKLSDNKVDSLLRSSTESKKLEEVWTASKMIGREVASDLIVLVKKRNELAKSLGYSNFQEMKLKLSEQDPKEIEKIFDELDQLTKDAYAQQKQDIDAYLSKRFSIPASELKPWHYQNRFFQEAPAIYNIDLEKYYKNADILTVAKNYYKGMGLDIEDVVSRSDIYEKPGKNQHAFSVDIDHSGDVRILVNLRNDSYWMNTLLHELGHSSYAKFNNSRLPFMLRDAAHAFTTEAIANMFGRFNANPYWMRDNLGISKEEVEKIAPECKKIARLDQLVFSRWAQVMFRFEKSMYENPDQDLNKLWWDLVEKYQLLKRPEGRNEPDWASKIHIATVPCYYHNYLLGQMLASQIYFTIGEKVLESENPENESFSGSADAGKFLIEKIFKPGARYPWNEMIEKATGEKLTARFYARQYVN